MVATVSREIPGKRAPYLSLCVPAYMAQFYAFEGLRRIFRQPDSKIKDPLAVLIAGGMGGVACWVASYPPDVVKSNIQADLLGLTSTLLSSYLQEQNGNLQDIFSMVELFNVPGQFTKQMD